MFKRIVSLSVVVCLLLSLFCVTASAADIYEVDKSAALMSTSPLSVSDSGISTAAVEPSDLDDYLSYGSYSAADYLASLNQYFWGTTVPKYSGYTFITNLTELFRDFFNSAGFYLRDDGSSSNINYSNNIADLVRMGFLGLSTNIKAVTSAIQALEFNDYSSILSSIYSSVDGLESGLTAANTAIGGLTTAVNNVRTAVNNVVSGLSTVNTSVGTVNTSVGSLQSALLAQLETRTGEVYVNSNNTEGSSNSVKPRLSFIIRNGLLALNRTLTLNNGETYLNDYSSSANVLTDKARLSYIVSQGFLGLANLLQVDPGEDYLTNSGGKGNIATNSGRLSWLIREGLLGLSANIKGSETDNIYTSIINDNNNTATTMNSTGLGPLLNTQLSNIGENLGHLAYIFASDDDIKLKEDSQPLVDATDSFFDDSDTNVKVSADNIGSLKDYVGQASDILDTNTDADDIFTVVSNENSWLWFSTETAADLNTVPVPVAELDEDIYNSGFAEQLYADFYDTYFPDR